MPAEFPLDELRVYQVFPRNLSPEGDLDAVIPRLEGIKELGFDWLYLTPVHPVGRAARKGSLGSPYAVADYRSVDPALGGEAALRRLLDAAHGLGLKVMLDIVYNHCAPDSLIARERPDWLLKGVDGRPAPRVADWSDVVDLDYSKPGLRDYLVETLAHWARFGADGFRCDVASMVPLDFWVEARRALAGTKPLLWLAESVHKEFLRDMRRRGLAMASDPELHAAFDLSYDYDAREELEAAWRGEAGLEAYRLMLLVQESHYPAAARKLRFLENHDQPRAAARFGRGARLRNWTLFSMLLPGAYLAYMGQELAMERRIGLFDREPMEAGEGDPAFRSFFAEALDFAGRAKAEAPLFELSLPAAGLAAVMRRGPGRSRAALLNLDGRSGSLDPGRLDLPEGFRELLGLGGARLELGPEPLLGEGRA